MLEEYKQNCRVAAELIPGWEDMSKNDLCRICILHENNPQLYNAYFSAILYKYWNLISKYYHMCSGLASPETCYDWLIIAVTYALEHRSWEDPESSIYNDPNGPDKVINRSMKSSRLNLYQFTNRKKRKEEFGILSLDELEQNFNNNSIDAKELIDSGESTLPLEIRDYIRLIFTKKDYFLAFMLDVILTRAVFDTVKDKVTGKVSQEFNTRKLAKYMREINEQYCTNFALTYDLDKSDVIATLKYCGNLSSPVIYNKIEIYINKLRHDPQFVNQWGGGRIINYVD